MDASTAMSPARVLANRLMVWPVAAACYASLVGAVAHWLTDTWSGWVTLGLLFSVAFGAPVLAGYAGYLWRKNLLQGNTRWEAGVCAAFPALLLLLAGLFISVGRVPWR